MTSHLACIDGHAPFFAIFFTVFNGLVQSILVPNVQVPNFNPVHRKTVPGVPPLDPRPVYSIPAVDVSVPNYPIPTLGPPLPQYSIPPLNNTAITADTNSPAKPVEELDLIPAPKETVACSEGELHDKEFDLVIYGATGYTGRLAAQYLGQRGHPDSPRWAIAGRSLKKLIKLQSTFSNKPDIIMVDLKSGADGLLGLARRTRAVLNFAGPFEINGAESLIRAALQGCAHYVDISTETVWNSFILRNYASTAKKLGVAIVQSAGFNSFASDFLAMSAITNSVEAHAVLPSGVMVVWSTLNTARSSGQEATDQYVSVTHKENRDAYILAPGTHEKIDSHPDGMEFYGTNIKQFAHAGDDCVVIRRSIFLQYPDSVITVQEIANSSLSINRMKFINGPKMTNAQRSLLRHPLLPGQGPPVWVRHNGSFAGEAIATYPSLPGSLPQNYRVTMEGYGDPSFTGSSKIATEVALGLALQGAGENLGGYLTPSSALGVKKLEQRLLSVDDGAFMRITHGSKD